MKYNNKSRGRLNHIMVQTIGFIILRTSAFCLQKEKEKNKKFCTLKLT